MEEKRIIKIHINGFSTQLEIPAAEEEQYRKAVKVLNERITLYTKKFALTYAEILSMVAYEFAVEAVKLEDKTHTAPIATIGKISQELSSLLDEE
ncbi:MAG: cell division protein ZapA [bacterium]